MFFTLKRDLLDWLDLPLNSLCGTVTLLSEDGEQVSVPKAVLLVSPLLRSLVSDLHPAAHHPLFLSLVVPADVLLTVGGILSKGEVKVENYRMKKKVQLVIKMLGLEASLHFDQIKSEPVTDKMLDETVTRGLEGTDGDKKTELEIVVKLENVEGLSFNLIKEENIAPELLISEVHSIGERQYDTVEEIELNKERKSKNLKLKLRQNLDNSVGNKDKRKEKGKALVKHPRPCTLVDCRKSHDEEATKKPVENQDSANNEITKIGGSIDVIQPASTLQSDERVKLRFSGGNEMKFGKEVQEEIVQFGVDHRSWIKAASKYGVSPILVQSWAKRSGISFLEERKSFMEGILQYGQKQGSWREAATKFDIPLYTVKLWAKKAKYELKGRKSRMGKEEVLQYGVKKGSWKEAADKFGVSLSTVRRWARRAGYKLQKKESEVERKVCKLAEVMKQGVDKETILQFGIKQNSWKEAAVQFGLSMDSVQSLAKKAGYKLNSMKGNKYPDDFKKTAIRFGEIEGWRAAARKFGVGSNSVREWAKKKRELVKNEEVNQEIIDYGDRMEQSNHTEAALKFGSSKHTVVGKVVP